MTNELLIRLARELPKNRDCLLRVPGLPSRFKGRSADTLLRIIRAASEP
jgi:hypothetical protein